MSKKYIQVITNEYRVIKELRERCIKNIEATTRTYIYFLGFIVTASSVLIDENMTYLIPILLVGNIVGSFTYKMIVATHIQFISYTRKLNFTRKSLMLNKKIKLATKLPIDENFPAFDTIGYTSMKFSEQGVLRLIQVLNSFMLLALLFLVLDFFESLYPASLDTWKKVIISLIFSISGFFLHQGKNDSMVEEAEKY